MRHVDFGFVSRLSTRVPSPVRTRRKTPWWSYRRGCESWKKSKKRLNIQEFLLCHLVSSNDDNNDDDSDGDDDGDDGDDDDGDGDGDGDGDSDDDDDGDDDDGDDNDGDGDDDDGDYCNTVNSLINAHSIKRLLPNKRPGQIRILR